MTNIIDQLVIIAIAFGLLIVIAVVIANHCGEQKVDPHVFRNHTTYTIINSCTKEILDTKTFYTGK